VTSNSLVSNGSAPAVKSESRPSYAGKRPPNSVCWFSDTSFDMTSLYPPFGVGSGEIVTCKRNEPPHHKHGNTRQWRSVRSDQNQQRSAEERAAGAYVVVVQALVDEAGEEVVGPDDARRPRGAVPGPRREHGLGAADADAERSELLEERCGSLLRVARREGPPGLEQIGVLALVGAPAVVVGVPVAVPRLSVARVCLDPPLAAAAPSPVVIARRHGRK
jgi:hypothetical protein